MQAYQTNNEMQCSFEDLDIINKLEYDFLQQTSALYEPIQSANNDIYNIKPFDQENLFENSCQYEETLSTAQVPDLPKVNEDKTHEEEFLDTISLSYQSTCLHSLVKTDSHGSLEVSKKSDSANLLKLMNTNQDQTFIDSLSSNLHELDDCNDATV